MTATDATAPADTRMMGIVHDAVRRDLRRAREVLTTGRRPPPAQRRAVADHLEWMMQFLRDHHRGEDEGIYPVVRERNPGAAAVLDRMDREHRAAAPALEAVEAAAVAYRAGDRLGEGERLLAAVDDLEAVLLPHLRCEEDEAMPIVSGTLTDGELRRLEHEHFLAHKSLAALGHEGHWLLDDLAGDRRHVVTGTVAAVPRFVLLHGFARSYRRRSAARWGRPPRPRRRVQTAGRAEVLTDAAPAAVWEVLRDVTRIGEWSHECRTAVWLDGATEAAPGARFRGRNRAGMFRWGRVCEVVTAEPGELTWRTVPSTLYPDTTTWTIRLHEHGRGTRIVQTFEGRCPKGLDLVYGTVIPAHRDRTRALTDDLRRLGAAGATGTGGLAGRPAPRGAAAAAGGGPPALNRAT